MPTKQKGVGLLVRLESGYGSQAPARLKHRRPESKLPKLTSKSIGKPRRKLIYKNESLEKLQRIFGENPPVNVCYRSFPELTFRTAPANP